MTYVVRKGGEDKILGADKRLKVVVPGKYYVCIAFRDKKGVRFIAAVTKGYETEFNAMEAIAYLNGHPNARP